MSEHIKFETRNNLYLLINFGEGMVSSAIVEHSTVQNQCSVLCYTQSYTPDIQHGRIKNIESVSRTLKNNLIKLKKSINLNLPFGKMKTIISISSRTGDIITSHGILNFLTGPITSEEINRVVKAALYNSNVSSDSQQILNLKVNDFVVDDVNNIKNPIDMSCQRLEANITLEVVNKTSVYNNLKKVLDNNQINMDYIYFDTSAISEAVLTKEDKSYGTITLQIKESYTKVDYFFNGTIKKQEVLENLGVNYIIENISKQYKLSFKVAQWIYQNLETIITKTKNQGLFELINSNNQAIRIELESLNSIIHKSLVKIFQETYTLLEKNNEEHYLNGILFLNDFKFNGVETIFNDIFIDHVKNTRKLYDTRTLNTESIFNLEVINNDLVVLGIVNFILDNSNISYNHLNKIEGTDKTNKIQTQTTFEENNDSKYELGELNINLEEKKNDGLSSKFKKIFKKIW